MLKKLSTLARIEMGIDDLFAGKTYAYVPVMDKGGMVGLGIATANEPGYTPISLNWARSDSYDVMSDHADELNYEWLELNQTAAARIVCSSMAAGRVKRVS